MNKAEKERVRDEIMLIQKLKHPKIIHFIKAWHNREKEEVVFITEIMTGGSLNQYLKRIKKPHLRVIKQWGKDILEGLEYLHSQKPYPVIHRDLKCDNIFVSSSTGDVRIGDLGLSTFMKNSHNKTILGTPQYMAPELYEERYGPSVDIYSFGLCILELCTHSVPYSECKTPLEIYNRVISGIKPQALDRILDLEVKEFIELCLSPVDQRPHAHELLENEFLVIDENDERVHHPVLIKGEDAGLMSTLSELQTPKLIEMSMKKDCKESLPVRNEIGKKNEKEQMTPSIMEVSQQIAKKEEGKEVKIELKVGLRDPLANKTKNVKLDFMYNTLKDTPNGISEEIILAFSVDPSYEQVLTQVIRDKIIETFKGCNSQEVKKLMSHSRNDSRASRSSISKT